MIPLRDKHVTRHFPGVTLLLIALNILVFAYELSLGARVDGFLFQFGLVPHNIWNAIHIGSLHPSVYVTAFSSMFLHGGWLHIAGNLLYLWIFGDDVEDKLGHLRFFFFYILCGLVAASLQVYFDPGSTVPMIGASGAVSGVLGGYILLFPRARVLTLIPIFIFIQIAEVPAFVVLGFWFVIQVFSGLLSIGQGAGASGGVAWWAHIGGFVIGMILIFPMKKYK